VSYRPLRGRVVIREHKQSSDVIRIVGGNPREEKTHRGTVIDVGPPVLTLKGAEVPLHFKPGDVVQFHFEATEKGRTTCWNGEDGVLVMAQREIDAVLE
jgi:co-chaperonin GroES (HSP10)